MDTMKKIHEKPSPRIQIGEPFERLIIRELLKKANTDNLSHDWNPTDMTRYALSELWKRTGKQLPRECVKLLPHFYADLDL